MQEPATGIQLHSIAPLSLPYTLVYIVNTKHYTNDIV